MFQNFTLIIFQILSILANLNLFWLYYEFLNDTLFEQKKNSFKTQNTDWRVIRRTENERFKNSKY